MYSCFLYTYKAIVCKIKYFLLEKNPFHCSTITLLYVFRSALHSTLPRYVNYGVVNSSQIPLSEFCLALKLVSTKIWLFCSIWALQLTDFYLVQICKESFIKLFNNCTIIYSASEIIISIVITIETNVSNG